MNLQAIGEAVAVIGVIVSLIYLAFEIRENTKTMRRAASSDIVSTLNDLGRYFLEYPELAQLYLQVNEGSQEISALERFRYNLLIMHLLSNFEIAIDYHRDGLLGHRGFETYAKSIMRQFENPIVIEWWQAEGQALYSQELRDLVSRHIDV
jgi:hypothetical protein